MHCPYCKKYFSTKPPLITHVEKLHQAELDANHMDAHQALFYANHGRLYSYCMCGCGRKTEWNYKTGKPYKVSPNPECKKRIAQQADERNISVYGKPKLLDDINRQKEMLKHRKIAGVYRFSDGGEVEYVAKLEKNFLWFLDTMLEFTSNMVLSADQHNIEIQYYDEKEKRTRTYIPDFYLPDYNALVEIKSSNSNPAYQKETAYKEKYKDSAAKNLTKYNYIKIVDAKYGPFMEFLANIVNDGKTGKRKITKTETYVISESACTCTDEIPMYETVFPGLHVVIVRDPIFHKVTAIALSESALFGKLYISSDEGLRETTAEDPVFDDAELDLYRYVGTKSVGDKIMRSAIDITEGELCENMNGMIAIQKLLQENNVNYAFDDIVATDNALSDFVKLDGSLPNISMEGM